MSQVNFNRSEIRGLPKSAGVQRRLREVAQRGAALAAALAPKLTGAGAASIHAEEQNDGSWLYSYDNEHDYMGFQELGTEHNRAQPFLRPSAKRLEGS